MNRLVFISALIFISLGCNQNTQTENRIPVARVGDAVLYYDEIPIIEKLSETDSLAIIRNYVNKWAKKELVFSKAEQNLSPQLKNDIEEQLRETRVNLMIYQYQRQMMIEKLDTIVTDDELENYYKLHEKSFTLNSNIVKAMFIKLPVSAPDIEKIRRLARSDDQKDLPEIESYCFQFAEIFDDFDENWITMGRLTVQLNQNIEDEENFLKRNKYFEYNDSSSIYLINIRDYHLRSSLAPYEYVKDDIKRIIWNNRRFEFIQSLENGIYNDALKEKNFTIY